MAGGEVDVGKTEGDAVEELVHTGTFPPAPLMRTWGQLPLLVGAPDPVKDMVDMVKTRKISYLLKSRIIKGPTSKRVDHLNRLMYSIVGILVLSVPSLFLLKGDQPIR